MGVSPFHGFDDRTHVGRQNMEFEQHSMYRRIHGVKSTMDTKLVRHARPQSAAAARAESDAFREVRETARRINDLSLKKRTGVTTFTSPPKSLGLSKRLSENRAAHRVADPTHAFHAKQVANMRRRISEQNLLVERKKNVYDTNVHPVLLRPKTAKSSRTPPWGFGTGHLSSAAARPTTARPTSSARPVARPVTSNNRPASARGAGAPHSRVGTPTATAAAPKNAGYWTSRDETGAGVAHMRATKPLAREHPAYQTLRKKLLHEIVAKDASEEDMADIFKEAMREQSGSQHKHVLKQVIADLKIELELQPEA
jgi:hypothetical protein